MIYTMGFTQKSAKEFFELVQNNSIEILIDVRLNNQSQLAGFTKGRDLSFFLDKICGCEYSHELMFAPTKIILDSFKKGIISWGEYEKQFNFLMKTRKAEFIFEKKYSRYNRVLFLCSEHTPTNCHRRLVAEYIQSHRDIEIIHL